MYKWERQVRSDYADSLDEAKLAVVRTEFERLRAENRSTMPAILSIYALIVVATVLFPYFRFSSTLLNSGLPEAILAVALAFFNLAAKQFLPEATQMLAKERIYELYGRYFMPQAMSYMQSEIAVSLETYRLIIALISAAGLLALALRKFLA